MSSEVNGRNVGDGVTGSVGVTWGTVVYTMVAGTTVEGGTGGVTTGENGDGPDTQPEVRITKTSAPTTILE